jgi:hypothetical protein
MTESKEDLLAAAAAAGLEVSEAQLARWHRAGLLPRPTVRSLGRGRGTESLYPPGSSLRLVRVAEVHRQEHRLSHAAWRLWWEDGGPPSKAARGFLANLAAGLDKGREQIVDVVEGDAQGEPEAAKKMDTLLNALERDRLPQPLGQSRRRSGATRFATVGRIIFEIAADRFQDFAVDSETGEDDGALLERSWGLERARTDHLATSGPWLEGDLAPDLARLGHLLAGTSMRELAQAPDASLDAARIELKEFVTTFTTAARMFERLFGKDAFGYGMLRDLFAIGESKGQATFLLGWLLLRQDESLHEGMRQLCGLSGQAQATERLYAVCQELRHEVPALAEVLSPERLGAAQLSVEGGEKLREELRTLANAHRSEVDAVLARYPDLEDVQQLAAGADSHETSHLSDAAATAS